MIYFIRNVTSGAVKIGISEEPLDRLRMLQTANAEPLELLGVMAGGVADEASWHRRFSRLRLRGEWFRGDPDLLAEVRRGAVRPGRNVWAECLLRGECRYGLRGVRAAHAPTRREFVCLGSEWDAGRRLILFAGDGIEEEALPPGRLVVSCAAPPAAPPGRYRADECNLLSPWPVVCCSPRRARA